jgi:hypothetical protein
MRKIKKGRSVNSSPLQVNNELLFSVNHILAKPELRSKNGFSLRIRGAGTLGSCPAEPKIPEMLLPAV